jgi:hypothetical protein
MCTYLVKIQAGEIMYNGLQSSQPAFHLLFTVSQVAPAQCTMYSKTLTIWTVCSILIVLASQSHRVLTPLSPFFWAPRRQVVII